MSPKVRLVLTSVLFVSWIGYLAYLVASTRETIVLSRPQFLVSNLYVIGTLEGDDDHPSGSVVIDEVPWAATDADRKLTGQTIAVKKLDKCKSANGWIGRGSYLLPISKLDKDNFLLSETPMSPGFLNREEFRLRIYPDTAETRAQLDDIVAKRTPF